MDTVLLTPGPVTVSRRVREAMLRDHGTWDADYLRLTERVREMLLAAGGEGGEYAVVPAGRKRNHRRRGGDNLAPALGGKAGGTGERGVRPADARDSAACRA